MTWQVWIIAAIVAADVFIMFDPFYWFLGRLSTRADGRRGRTRTCDPRLRRPVLYPTELRAREINYRARRAHAATAF